jgi:endoglucanase
MEFFAKSGSIYLNNNKVSLKGINYYGFETEIYALQGLWAVSLHSILDFLKANKFNAMRVPISLEAIFGLDTIKCKSINTTVNPEMVGWTAGKLLDTLVSECAKRGIIVMIDVHRFIGTGFITELWYDGSHPESKLIDGLKILAKRYISKPNVFALDLKNEPHGAARWAEGTAATNWDAAATRIGNAIHSVNPKLLIFVEGVDTFKGAGGWWGGNLRGAKPYPIILKVPNKLVYSPHVYGPSVANQPYFSDPNFPRNLTPIWDADFGYLKQTRTGTIMIGEWGGWMKPENKDDKWQNALCDYIVKYDIDFFYWCIGISGDTGAILQDDFKTPVKPKMDLLARAKPNPTVFNFTGSPIPVPTPVPTPTPTPKPTPVPTPKPTPVPTPTPTPTPPPTPVPTPTPSKSIVITPKITNTWNENNVKLTQYDVLVQNISTTQITHANFKIVGGKIHQLWNLQGNISQTNFTYPTWLPNGLGHNEQFTFGFITEGIPTISII